MNLELEKCLKSAKKEELIEILDFAIAENKLTESWLFSNFVGKKITEQEQSILTKIEQEQSALTIADKNFILTELEKVQNRSIKLLLQSRDSFIKRVIEHKIQSYFKIAWTEYPRKVGKQLGYKAFQKLLGEVKVKELEKYAKYIVLCIKKYAELCFMNNTEEQYIMHFSTFCNSKKYL